MNKWTKKEDDIIKACLNRADVVWLDAVKSLGGTILDEAIRTEEEVTQRAAALLEYFTTPAWLTDVIVDEFRLLELENVKAFDPCIGNGAILRRMIERGVQVTEWSAVDLVRHGPKDPRIRIRDLMTSVIPASSANLIVFNPPFTRATEFAEYLLQARQATVIMIAKSSVACSETRNEFWLNYPPDFVRVLPKRASFGYPGSTGGVDRYDYSIFGWVEHKLMGEAPAWRVIEAHRCGSTTAEPWEPAQGWPEPTEPQTVSVGDVSCSPTDDVWDRLNP